MRPRKRILLITSSPMLHDQYVLLLRTWGFAVAADAANVDAVLTVNLHLDQIPVLVAQHHPAALVAMVRRQDDCRLAAGVGAHLTAADNSTLREQLRTAVARKRGPKPHTSAVQPIGRAA